MQKKLLFLLVAVLMTSCGYKPSSHYIKHMFEDAIYVEVEVDAAEPENAPFVKDEMNRLVYTRFKGRVVKKEDAKNCIKVSYRGSRFRGVSFEDGYVTRYRADISVEFTMLIKDGKVSKSIRARHEDDIAASSLESSALRTEAIRKGLEKALDQFLAYASVKGIMIAEEKSDNNRTGKIIKDLNLTCDDILKPKLKKK
jgi:hypothetical protein